MMWTANKYEELSRSRRAPWLVCARVSPVFANGIAAILREIRQTVADGNEIEFSGEIQRRFLVDPALRDIEGRLVIVLG